MRIFTRPSISSVLSASRGVGVTQRAAAREPAPSAGVRRAAAAGLASGLIRSAILWPIPVMPGVARHSHAVVALDGAGLERRHCRSVLNAQRPSWRQPPAALLHPVSRRADAASATSRRRRHARGDRRRRPSADQQMAQIAWGALHRGGVPDHGRSHPLIRPGVERLAAPHLVTPRAPGMLLRSSARVLDPCHPGIQFSQAARGNFPACSEGSVLMTTDTA